MATKIEQKLAAILVADVVGYTRLMADDEPATIATITDYRSRFRDHITANGGRVVDMAGDSVLAIFTSVAGAMRAAVATQAELTGRNEGRAEARRMHFRIGVNLGDIHELEDGTVYGDGVNIAARLESLAERGGIMLSEDAWRQVRRDPATWLSPTRACTMSRTSPIPFKPTALKPTRRTPRQRPGPSSIDPRSWCSLSLTGDTNCFKKFAPLLTAGDPERLDGSTYLI